MELPEDTWRVTYTPGNWLVLAGPTSLLVMLPAPPKASGLLEDMWRSMLGADSVAALMTLVSEAGLEAMPHLGAFFWDDAGLHALMRGNVRVLDADTSAVVLDGAGSLTWHEEQLGTERRLRIDLEPQDGVESLRLPLIAGVAGASTIHLSTVAQDAIVFPTAPPAEAELPGQPSPDAATPYVESALEVPPVVAAPAAAIPIPPPAAEPEPEVSFVADVAPEPEADGATVLEDDIAATHEPSGSPDDVAAVFCVAGHANAPGARVCRLCRAAVEETEPTRIPRPVLAGVQTNSRDFMDIVTGVLIGRAPDVTQGPPGTAALRVTSPSSDISRSHLLLTTRDWNVYATDLRSTNGTMVLPVGEAPFALSEGATVQVEIGTVLDLGDGVSIRIEPPRG